MITESMANPCRYFEKALSINPNDAQIWIRKGDADLAISVMEMQTMRQKYRALTADTPALSDPSYNSSGNIDDVQSTQSYRDAIDSYNEAIKIDPLVSVEISSHVLASTQTLVNMYQGIMNDIGSAITPRVTSRGMSFFMVWPGGSSSSGTI